MKGNGRFFIQVLHCHVPNYDYLCKRNGNEEGLLSRYFKANLFADDKREDSYEGNLHFLKQ